MSETTQQLSNIAYQGVASAYGVDGKIGTADATSLLNTYFATLKTNELKYAIFDKNVTYNVSGALDNARGLILLGNAKINSTNPLNNFIKITNTQDYFNGKINKCQNPKTALAQFNTAIAGTTNPKVAIWGDSISTGGSVALNQNYMEPSGFWETSPNGLTIHNTYYARLISLITKKYQSKTFDFYNYAIGGTSINEWNTQKTFGTSTKTWIDFCKDAQPDLIIIGFGMNCASYEDTILYKKYLNQVITYIKANFNPIPSIALITNPRPVLALDDVSYGTTERQQSRYNAAFTTRESGYKNNCYIIDVGRLSDIKRMGTDVTKVHMEDITSNANITCSGSQTDGIYTLANMNTIFLENIMEDFEVSFELLASSTTGDTDALWINYNQSEDTSKYNALLLFPRKSDGYIHFASYTNFNDQEGGIVKNALAPFSLNDGKYHKITIEKRGAEFICSIDDTRWLKDYVDAWSIEGKMQIINKTNNSVQIKNFMICKGIKKQYVPTMTESDYFGEYVAGNTGTKPLTGGNGVNHPSTKGLEVYEECLAEFVDDIMKYS
jgi:hypothetical protein